MGVPMQILDFADIDIWFHSLFLVNLQEDEHIIYLVEKYGCKKWSVIAKFLNGRIGKQCRER